MITAIKIFLSVAVIAGLFWLLWQAALAADEQRKHWPWDDTQ